MIDQLRKQVHELRLMGMCGTIERRLSQADKLTHGEFLSGLLSDEQHWRRQASAKRLIARAKFVRTCNLEEWDTTFDRGITRTKLQELCSFNFFNHNVNLLLLGKTGEGKSHLAMALGRRMCEQSISVHFHQVNLLFETIAAERAAGAYLKWLAHIHSAKVLVLDDFGLRRYNHDEATCLMDILEGHYQKGTCIVTSQVDPKGWLKLFDDTVIAEAIVERLTKPSEIIRLRGGSYRDRLGETQKSIEPGKQKH